MGDFGLVDMEENGRLMSCYTTSTLFSESNQRRYQCVFRALKAGLLGIGAFMFELLLGGVCARCICIFPLIGACTRTFDNVNGIVRVGTFLSCQPTPSTSADSNRQLRYKVSMTAPLSVIFRRGRDTSRASLEQTC